MFNYASALSSGSVSVIKTQPTRHIDQALINEAGDLIPAPSDLLASFSHESLRYFLWEHGIYSLPSIELLRELREYIPDIDKCLEIGAGNGIYGRSLGCHMIDNFMQHPKNDLKFKGSVTAYRKAGQPLTWYGEDVEELDARDAIRRYRPETVICSWVTHRYNPRRPDEGGNMFGVDFDWVFKRKNLQRIILIGNEKTHEHHPIRNHPNTVAIKSPHLFSRSQFPELDRIYYLEV